MKQIATNYTFDATAKTVTLNGLNIPLSQILMVAGKGKVLYSFADGVGATNFVQGANSVLTLQSTTGLTNTDKLTIFYDDGGELEMTPHDIVICSSKRNDTVMYQTFPANKSRKFLKVKSTIRCNYINKNIETLSNLDPSWLDRHSTPIYPNTITNIPSEITTSTISFWLSADENTSSISQYVDIGVDEFGSTYVSPITGAPFKARSSPLGSFWKLGFQESDYFISDDGFVSIAVKKSRTSSGMFGALTKYNQLYLSNDLGTSYTTILDGYMYLAGISVSKNADNFVIGTGNTTLPSGNYGTDTSAGIYRATNARLANFTTAMNFSLKYSGEITALAGNVTSQYIVALVRNPSNTSSTLIYSSDYGENWTVQNNNVNVATGNLKFYRNPNGDSVIYIIPFSGNTLKSTNLGVTFVSVSNNPTGLIHYHAEDAGKSFGYNMYSGISVSTNLGATWSGASTTTPAIFGSLSFINSGNCNSTGDKHIVYKAATTISNNFEIVFTKISNDSGNTLTNLQLPSLYSLNAQSIKMVMNSTGSIIVLANTSVMKNVTSASSPYLPAGQEYFVSTDGGLTWD